VRVWETETGKPLTELRGPAGQIANLALAYSPDGKTLAAAGGQRGRLGELMLWDWQGAKEAPVVEQPFKLRQWCVAFSPDGKYVAVGGGDGTVSVVDVGTGKSRAAFSLPKYVRCVSFSPDGKRLAASYGDQGRLSLYEWEAAKQLCDFQAPVAKLVLGATFSPDGKTLLTPYGDGTAILWDASAVPPRILGTLNSGARQSWFVLFFPDGRTVATGSDDGTIRLMKVDNPK